MQFNEFLWHGHGNESYGVYHRNPITKEVVRIDFQDPEVYFYWRTD